MESIYISEIINSELLIYSLK